MISVWQDVQETCSCQPNSVIFCYYETSARCFSWSCNPGKDTDGGFKLAVVLTAAINGVDKDVSGTGIGGLRQVHGQELSIRRELHVAEHPPLGRLQHA